MGIRIDNPDELKDFGGKVYSKQMTMTNDLSQRFETDPKKLRDVLIQVTVQTMLFGKQGTEVYSVAAGVAIGFVCMEISTLFFKNATAGQNGTVTILGVEV